MKQKIGRRAMLACSASASAAVVGLFAAPDEAAAGQTPVPAGHMRRIVTGRNAQGKSYIVSDEMAAVGNLWTTKPDQPIGQAPPGEPRTLTHATGEGRFFVAAIQPSKDPKPNLENRGGFHETPGIAYCYILNGELVFLVDTQEVKVRAGDLIVERNTFHSWRNEGTTPVSMLITVVNASA
jgi:hypothetical protein